MILEESDDAIGGARMIVAYDLVVTFSNAWHTIFKTFQSTSNFNMTRTLDVVLIKDSYRDTACKP